MTSRSRFLPRLELQLPLSCRGILRLGTTRPTAQLDGFGDLVQSGVTYSHLNASPSLGTSQFCTDCEPTTPLTCNTANPANSLCVGSTSGNMTAGYENFMNNGANWYCR